MSKDEMRADQPASDDAIYNVGYRKPPATSRFQPGCSGNPKGRPKGARNRRQGPDGERLKTIVFTEAHAIDVMQCEPGLLRLLDRMGKER